VSRANGDLIGPGVDAFDQRGEDSTPACSGKLEPALADLGSSRHETALR
jgi:hypothetical protein